MINMEQREELSAVYETASREQLIEWLLQGAEQAETAEARIEELGADLSVMDVAVSSNDGASELYDELLHGKAA